MINVLKMNLKITPTTPITNIIALSNPLIQLRLVVGISLP